MKFGKRHLFVEQIVLPVADRVSHSNFWSLARRMARLENLPSRELLAMQEKRLGQLFNVAVESTDFWPSRLSDVSFDAAQPSLRNQLRNLTPTMKSELEAGFPDQTVNRFIDQADLRFAATRGTTQRMICVHDFAKRDSMRAAMVHTLRASGYRLGMPMVEIPPDICDVVCGEQGERDEGVGLHLWHMFRRGQVRDVNAIRDLRGIIERRWIYNRKNYPAFGSAGSSPTDEQLDDYILRLKTDRPYLLKGLTTYLYEIAKRLLQRGDVGLKIPVIKPLGSGATPAMRKTIEAAFGGRFHDDYGSAELGAIACDCQAHQGMHIFSDLFIVEIVDTDGHPVPNGQLGEVVVTDLINHAMPLIRYRIGDLGRIETDPCECGLTSPRIFIEGRIQDALITSSGQRVTSFEIAEKLYQESWLDQFQLIEKRGGVLELTCVVADNQSVDQTSAEAIIRDLLGDDRKLRVRTVRTIAAEPGGKFRWVKAHSSPKPVNT